MAQTKLKPPAHREKPTRLTSPAAEPLRPWTAPAEREPGSGPGSRLVVIVWGLGFLLLFSLLLWDFVSALLFR